MNSQMCAKSEFNAFMKNKPAALKINIRLFFRAPVVYHYGTSDSYHACIYHVFIDKNFSF